MENKWKRDSNKWMTLKLIKKLPSASFDTYMSHEGVIYCKPHHRELFQPRVVKSDLMDVEARSSSSFTQEAISEFIATW